MLEKGWADQSCSVDCRIRRMKRGNLLVLTMLVRFGMGRVKPHLGCPGIGLGSVRLM